jgi:hypothetical protein
MSGVRRLFWVALGATAGVLVVRKITKTAQAYTPQGMASVLSVLVDGLRELAGSVRDAMAERDAELRLALGVDEGPIDPDRARALIDQPIGDHPSGADGGRASNPARRSAGRAG